MFKLNPTLGFVGPLLILFASSLLILNSVAPTFAQTQIIFAILGLILFFIIGKIDYQLYLFSPWPWYAISNLLLLSTFFLGVVTRGAVRWIEIFGVSFQPSEFVKPMLILFIASYLTHYFPQTIKDLLIYGLLMLVPTLLIYLQPDLGTSILMLIISAAALLAAGVEFKKLGIVTLVGLLFVPLIFMSLKPYQKQRLTSFIDPNADPLGAGYNVLQATIAVGSGQLIGRGLGQGTQSHLRFLPERHTDFIYASLTEELGFIGGIIILGAYLWLSISLVNAAKLSNSEVGSIICLTSLTLILSQVFINIGMNMGLLPITGITLPLISAGGSSILSFMLILAICFSVANHPATKKASLEIR
jgi:rod shape determining protein RodA